MACYLCLNFFILEPDQVPAAKNLPTVPHQKRDCCPNPATEDRLKVPVSTVQILKAAKVPTVVKVPKAARVPKAVKVPKAVWAELRVQAPKAASAVQPDYPLPQAERPDSQAPLTEPDLQQDLL